ncbi:hypothetical protein DFQ04_1663 [Algoriphagus boseongensis]|uniref:Uncharacterized protein n=1 Tax=Algoriphagus boseongensis TaxID=1442587 RepID=A0A4R6T731_9BACT|nr:hypothetical protein [Algoriphagus boseongensis]TDQ17015.1 hypothetical protein DFQ04_1663 [Algoriphagus boseongensis]
MLTFFRKIRQKLLSQNRVTRYLVYAIGEILLVVIGILIALQVNNWNEQRKAAIRWKTYQKRFIEDFEVILEDTENSILGNEKNLRNSILVKNALESKYLPDSSIINFETYLGQYHQYYMTMAPLSTYEEMISAGELNLIPSSKIRDAFSGLSGYRSFIIEVNKAYHDAEIMKTSEFQRYVRYTILNPGTDSSKVIPSYDFNSMAGDSVLINKVSRQSVAWNSILGMFKGYKMYVSAFRDSIQLNIEKIEIP